MTTFKKILGAAVTAMLVSAPVAATAAQPVRPGASLVSSTQGVKAGIRSGTARKGSEGLPGGSMVIGGITFLILIIGGVLILKKDKEVIVSPR